MICDFCSATPAYRHECKTFTLTYPLGGATNQFTYEQDWMACDRCHRLIVASKHGELVERAYRAYQRDNSIPPSLRHDTRLMLVAIHDGFWANRTGQWAAMHP